MKLRDLLKWPRAESGDDPIAALHFDRSLWQRQSRRPDRELWRDAVGDTLTIVARPTDEATDAPPGQAGAIAAFRAMAEQGGGGIVSAEDVSTRGTRIYRGIIKKKKGTGHDYAGTLIVSLARLEFVLTIAAGEQGTTGMREAMVTGHLFQRGELSIDTSGPPGTAKKLEGWCFDPYDPGADEQALNSLSDDERFDLLLPMHPLSRVRRSLAVIQRSLVVSASVPRRPTTASVTDAPRAPVALRRPLSAETIGTLYFQAQRFDTAERFLLESIAELGERPDAGRLAMNLTLLGMCQEMQRRLTEALTSHARALELLSAATDVDAQRAADAATHLARLHLMLDQLEQAEPYLLRALAGYERGGLSGGMQPAALTFLGIVHASRGAHALAMEHHERALAIFEREEGPDGADVADVLFNMARSLHATGDEKKAKEVEVRMARIRAKLKSAG